MKLENFFFALFGLLLAATGMLAMHYRGELMAERRIAELSRQAPAIPRSPAATQPPAEAMEAVSVDRAALQRQLDQAETEKNLLASKVKQMTGGNDAPLTAAEPAESASPVATGTGELTANQLRIKEAAPIARIQQYLPDQGFAVIDAGSARGLKTGQTYAVRRGHFIIAKKVEIGETVEESQSVVGVNASALQPGETLKPGDEVIKWE